MIRIRLSFYLAALVFSTGCINGCGSTGGSSEESAEVSNGNNAATAAASRDASSEQPDSNAGDGGAAKIGERRQDERWTDANGVEYLGNVPLDVFYDQPLKVAGDQTLLTGGPVGNPQAPAAMTTPTFEPTEPPPSDSTTPVAAVGKSWADLISADEIKNEVTDSRNFLNRSLQRYGDYKKAMLMIPGKAASIAVLSHIAMEHPESVSWKDDAIYVRDLAKKMNDETLKPDKKSHTRVLTLFENIASTLDRSRPSDLEEPNADDSYVDVAGMDMLMVRLEEAEKRLRTEAGSESAFQSQKEMIKHEAAMLGTLSHVITLEGYGYADDDEFKGYADSIVTAAKTIRDSIETNDFNSYELALSKVSTSCSDCHSAYRNN